MHSFNLGALTDWSPVGNGEILKFATNPGFQRQVEFRVMADDIIAVIASDKDGQSWLVAVGMGMMEVKFGLTREVALTFAGPDGCSIFVQSRARAQVLSEDPEPSFTNLEPRRMSSSDKVTRMQQIMAQNAQRRTDALLADLEAREQALAAKFDLFDKAPAPAPAPAPDPAPAPAPGDGQA